ncbi:MAG: sulfatase-like hydrolase/transferase [Fuerstiella sp.]|nr:sulfatase-like hydrolase/transferase [Fuerstiella sp.]MCP4858523.1 sulfatase-like hydrolase/transferase [Fuerstiella sp.]
MEGSNAQSVTPSALTTSLVLSTYEFLTLRACNPKVSGVLPSQQRRILSRCGLSRASGESSREIRRIACAPVCSGLETGHAQAPPNVLLITADDLNYGSVGCYGCEIPGITPNIDKLASEGMRFTNAHVNIAVCQPSRQSIMTGRYPHRNGAEGFRADQR